MNTTSINLASIHVGLVIQEFKKCGKFDIKLKAKYLGVWMRRYDATLHVGPYMYCPSKIKTL